MVPWPAMKTTGAAVARNGFAAMLAAFAVVLAWVGVQAIEEARYVSTSTVTRSFGVGLVGSEHGGTFTDVFTGASAQRIGAGFISFGLLLAVWALGIVVNGPREPQERPGPLARAAGVLYVAGVILFCPPWLVASSRDAALFWGAALVWSTALALIARHRLGHRAVAVVLPLFAATFLAEFVIPLRSSGGLLFGLIASLGGVAQAAYVYAPWRRRLLSYAKAAESEANERAVG